MSNPQKTGATSTTDGSAATTGRGDKAIAWLMTLTLSLVALQPISAGFSLSGFAHAATLHSTVAAGLQVVAVAQGGAAVLLWWRRRLTGRVAGLCVGLLVMVSLEVWAGRNREYWLHVPLGAGILLWLRGRM